MFRNEIRCTRWTRLYHGI